MSIRLNKALRELNIGLQTAVEFLEKRKDLGEVKAEPSFKLSDQQYKALNDAFSQDKEVRDQAEKLITKKAKDKKRAPEQKDHRAESLLESSNQQQYKPLGKIDLDSIGKGKSVESAAKKSEASKHETAAVSHAPVKDAHRNEPKHDQRSTHGSHQKQEMKQENQQKSQQPKMNDFKGQKNAAQGNKNVEAQQQNAEQKAADNSQPSSVFTLKSEKKYTSNEPKVLGKIDLSSLNQSTRPKKKSKEERRKEREEKLAQQHNDRKKRVRINKERVDINAEAKNNSADGNGQNKGNNGGNNKKNRNKNRNNNNNNNNRGNNNNNRGNQRQIEVDDEAVARQVKETLARLTSKSQNKKGAKYRKEKREAVQEKLQDQARQEQKESKILKLTEFVTVSELATMMDISVTQVISTLMGVGIMVSINQRLDAETINMVAEEFGFKTEYVSAEVQEAVSEEEDDENDLVPRAPIVTVMGHVDHGKTSLLDYIRNTNVIAGEAGGITQHIGAYSVTLKSGRKVTFLDTPGHEAFTAMRARGAKATDIAILVVAADDGIMPQTVEAINHAKAAGVDIIVAINKMDKPGANPEGIKQELTKYDLVPEEWGGDVMCVPVSALTKKGIDQLLESVLLVADMKELKANPNRRAKGIIIESKLDKGRGPVATVLVQNGTLHTGDIVIAGTAVGRVRTMNDHNGRIVKEAGPSVPVEVIGLAEVPEAGDEFAAVEDERMARTLADQRRDKAKEEGFKANARANLNDLFAQISEGVKELNIIVKADVAGSAEAVKQSLEKLSNEEVRVHVIHAAVGGIIEGDVMLAAASNAIIVGFNVRPDKMAIDSAERQKVDIRTYRVIYECIDEIGAAMKGMLAPKYKEVVLGHAEVRQTIHVPNVGTIAGSYVQDGKITRASQIRVVRDGVVIFEDKISSLRRFKDDVKEVADGYECGIGLDRFGDIKVGDILEAFVMEEIQR